MSGEEFDAKARANREAVDREYPYDPTLRMHELRGIEKLRAEPDRELAAVQYPSWKRLEERIAPREVFKPRAPAQPVPQSRELLDWER